MRGLRVPRFALEGLLLAGLYLAGELARGFARGGAATAEAHADAIVRLERRLHVFDETTIQRAAHHVDGLTAFLGYAYLSLHLAVTVSVLAWVYACRRHAYARLRNTLALASLLAVAGYALFPTAPPAVPSMHIGFSLVVAVAVVRLARHRLVRIVGALYPVFVLFMIVATGNHFFVDAAAGALAAAVAAVAAPLLSVQPGWPRRGARRRDARGEHDVPAARERDRPLFVDLQAP